jgi:hypothetical protein
MIAWELDGKLLCDECYFKTVDEKGVEEKDDYLITMEKWRLKFGDENQKWVKNMVSDRL